MLDLIFLKCQASRYIIPIKPYDQELEKFLFKLRKMYTKKNQMKYLSTFRNQRRDWKGRRAGKLG